MLIRILELLLALAIRKKSEEKKFCCFLSITWEPGRATIELGPCGVNKRNNSLFPHEAAPFLINQWQKEIFREMLSLLSYGVFVRQDKFGTRVLVRITKINNMYKLVRYDKCCDTSRWEKRIISQFRDENFRVSRQKTIIFIVYLCKKRKTRKFAIYYTIPSLTKIRIM